MSFNFNFFFDPSLNQAQGNVHFNTDPRQRENSSYVPAPGFESVSRVAQPTLSQIPGINVPITKTHKSKKPDCRRAMEKLESVHGFTPQVVADLFGLTMAEYQKERGHHFFQPSAPERVPGSTDSGAVPSIDSNSGPFFQSGVFDNLPDLLFSDVSSSSQRTDDSIWTTLLSNDNNLSLNPSATINSNINTITVPLPPETDKWNYEQVMYIKSEIDKGQCTTELRDLPKFPTGMKVFSSVTTNNLIKRCAMAHINPSEEIYPDEIVKVVYEMYLRNEKISTVSRVLQGMQFQSTDKKFIGYRRVSELYHYAQYRGPHLPVLGSTDSGAVPSIDSNSGSFFQSGVFDNLPDLLFSDVSSTSQRNDDSIWTTPLSNDNDLSLNPSATINSNINTITVPLPPETDKWNYEQVMYVKSQIDKGQCSTELHDLPKFPNGMKIFLSETINKLTKRCAMAHINPSEEIYPDEIVKVVYEMYLRNQKIKTVLSILQGMQFQSTDKKFTDARRVSELYRYAQYRGPHLP